MVNAHDDRCDQRRTARARPRHGLCTPPLIGMRVLRAAGERRMVWDGNNDFGENVAFRSISKRHAGRVGRAGVVSIAPESRTENVKISGEKTPRPYNTDTSHYTCTLIAGDRSGTAGRRRRVSVRIGVKLYVQYVSACTKIVRKPVRKQM